MSIPLYFTFSPEEAAAVTLADHPAACLGYHLAADAPALLAPQPEPEIVCRMVLQDSTLPNYPTTTALAHMVVQYAASRHSGLICDFNRPPTAFWREFLPMLEAACLDASLPFWVPEAYGDCAPKSPVIVSSACVEGTFQHYLEASAARKSQGCILELTPLACTIALPCQDGPQWISRDEAAERRSQCGPSGFSEALCCHWGLPSTDPITVLLWDDQTSLEKKLNLAQDAGFQAAIGLWQELDFLAKP